MGLAERLTGDTISDAFEPAIAATGKPLKTDSFRNLLQAVGWNWIAPAAIGDPAQAGWTEAGAFDRYGHEQGAKLAWRIDEELQAVLDRVTELLQGGWNTIMLITDHGWLLVPGGLRLRVRLEGPAAGLTLDLRTQPADPGSSLLEPGQRLKPVDIDGKAALTVTDDDRIGQAALLVVVKDHQVICKQAVTIGEN